MPEDYFGEDVPARYDETIGEYGESATIEASVGFLAQLAGDGAALELGIGTGRIALPLAARGVARAARRSQWRPATSRRLFSVWREA